MRKKGFTFAEVMITLAILGIVAALILPGVIGNIQQKRYASGYKKSLNNMNKMVEKLYLNDGVTMNTFTNAKNAQGKQKYKTWGDLISQNMNVQKIDNKGNIYLSDGTMLIGIAKKTNTCGNKENSGETPHFCTIEIDVNGDAGPNKHSTGSIAKKNLKLGDRFFILFSAKEAFANSNLDVPNSMTNLSWSATSLYSNNYIEESEYAISGIKKKKK